MSSVCTDPEVHFFPRGLFFHEKGKPVREISIRRNIPHTEKLTFNEVSSILVPIGLAFLEGIDNEG